MLITFLVYSFSVVLCKLASLQDFLSFSYLICFVGVLLSLGVYAVFWQKVLSFTSLNKAYLCKSVTIFFILTLSYFCFAEAITINNIIGAFFIIGGLIVLAWRK